MQHPHHNIQQKGFISFFFFFFLVGNYYILAAKSALESGRVEQGAIA